MNKSSTLFPFKEKKNVYSKCHAIKNTYGRMQNVFNMKKQ